jgi:hypothetical protein
MTGAAVLFYDAHGGGRMEAGIVYFATDERATEPTDALFENIYGQIR